MEMETTYAIYYMLKIMLVQLMKIFHNGKIGETYNVGGFNEWKNIDIINLLIKKNGFSGRIEGSSRKLITFIKDRPGHDLRYAIDVSKLKNELGWEPNIQLNEGLNKTINWYLKNPKWINNITTCFYKTYYDTNV